MKRHEYVIYFARAAQKVCCKLKPYYVVSPWR